MDRIPKMVARLMLFRPIVILKRSLTDTVTDTQPPSQRRCRSYYAQRSGVEPNNTAPSLSQNSITVRGVRVEHFSYPTRPAVYPYRSLPVWITVTRYNRPSGLPPPLWPGPLHCISSDESIFCCGYNMSCMHHQKGPID